MRIIFGLLVSSVKNGDTEEVATVVNIMIKIVKIVIDGIQNHTTEIIINNGGQTNENILI